MRNTDVAQAVQKLVQFNKGTQDRILFLWWNASDIEHHADHLDDKQLAKLWGKVWNDDRVQDALSHAETIVEDALSESVMKHLE
jgi:hypothetical protein